MFNNDPFTEESPPIIVQDCHMNPQGKCGTVGSGKHDYSEQMDTWRPQDNDSNPAYKVSRQTQVNTAC